MSGVGFLLSVIKNLHAIRGAWDFTVAKIA